jgi:hypothetical protein
VIHVDAGIGPVHRHAEHDLARETRDRIGADRPDPVVRHGVLDQPEAFVLVNGAELPARDGAGRELGAANGVGRDLGRADRGVYDLEATVADDVGPQLVPDRRRSHREDRDGTRTTPQ